MNPSSLNSRACTDICTMEVVPEVLCPRCHLSSTGGSEKVLVTVKDQNIDFVSP